MYLSENEERRFVLRLFEYWHTVRAVRRLPAPGQMNPNDIGKDMASCVVIDVTPGIRQAVLVKVGQRLVPDGWADARGMTAADCPGEGLLCELLRDLQEAVVRKAPVSRGRDFILRGRPALGRVILLPLSVDDYRVTHVFGGINFKFMDTALDRLTVIEGGAAA